MNAVNAIGGSIGGTLGSSIGVSKATMQDCMRRLVKTYEESSGKSYSGDEEILDTTGMSPFDALRALIGAKIDATRKKIAIRDETLRTRQGGPTRTAKLSNDIKKMIKLITDDFEKLRQLQLKNANKKSFFSNQEKLEQHKIRTAKEAEEIKLLAQHIIALENEDKKRFKVKEDSKVTAAVNKVKEQLLGGFGGEDEIPKSGMLQQNSNVDDIGFEDLPELDISQALMKVDQNKAQIEEGLEIFSKKLDQLGSMSRAISDELDEQKLIMDDLDEKAAKELERLKNLNKKVESAAQKSGGILRWVFVLLGSIVLCALVAVIYVLIQNYVRPLTGR